MTSTYSRLLFGLLALLPTALAAQVGQNIIPNGSFEEYATTATARRHQVRADSEASNEDGDENEDGDDENDKPSRDFDPYAKPLYWYINPSLYSTRVTDAHSGKFALKLYPNGGSFFTRDKEFNIYHLKVEAGAEYRLTYWYKGQKMAPNVIVTVDWLRGGTRLKKDARENKADYATNISAQWQQKVLTFTAPAGADHAGVGFYLNYDSEANEKGGFIVIDDIEMVQTSAGNTDNRLAPPENLKAKTQQRELELSWLPTAEPEVSYEVKVNGKVTGTTTGTNFVVTQLAPGTSYNIEVVTLKNNTRSAKAATLSTATEALTHAVNDENRIPYLYKVRENGTCPRALPLFWKELADANAKITYWVDDQQQEPTDGRLLFTKSGEHFLHILVVESDGRDWELDYQLNVD